MPAYPGAALATVPLAQAVTALYPGQSIYLFGVPTVTTAPVPPLDDTNVAFETVTAGESSISVSLATGLPGNPPPMVCVEISFSAAPGAFELDIQEADTDADAFYILMTANSAYKVTSVNATTFIARADLSPTGGKFMRVTIPTLTNAVKCKVKLTRLA